MNIININRAAKKESKSTVALAVYCAVKRRTLKVLSAYIGYLSSGCYRKRKK